ncbi:uncharacterized protein [Drosophila suzukii]|uniref:Uncharacterized protein n=1 Tax=Drosophila suzukii TaxID=28584 RepID=A0ABM4TYA6_DROSZ|nr:uncharacterized protein LOC118879098 [Drosophila suzukii]XP_036677978.1 uncharacterized protein LOC118879098 [Drosophila suzukii]
MRLRKCLVGEAKETAASLLVYPDIFRRTKRSSEPSIWPKDPKMGSKKSKVDGSTANVINTVEIVDHKNDIQDVNKTMKVIVGLLLILVILGVVKMYKRSVQRRRDQHHALDPDPHRSISRADAVK